MSLKITVDEDLPGQAVKLLRDHGYDAASALNRAWADGKMPTYGLPFKKTKDIW